MRQKGMRKDGGAECKGCEFVNSLMDKPRMKITASVYEYIPTAYVRYEMMRCVIEKAEGLI